MNMLIEFQGRKMMVTDENLQMEIWRMATQIGYEDMPKRHNLAWSTKEETLVLQMWQKQLSVEEIATKVQRKPDSVKKRIQILLHGRLDFQEPEPMEDTQEKEPVEANYPDSEAQNIINSPVLQ